MEKENQLSSHDMNHDMICNEEICHDNNNHSISNHDMSKDKSSLSKSEWWYLVNQLEAWRVFAPRAVVKKNPALAWRVMNLCKDPGVRIKGAYFTTVFRRELNKLENAEKIAYWQEIAHQKFGHLLKKA